MCQWFNVINCRSAIRSAFTTSLLRNRWLAIGLVLSIGLQLVVLYAPPMNTLFHTVPLPPHTLLALALTASVVLWAEELRKLLARRAAA
jgi:Ca2+-transporting ATPase